MNNSFSAQISYTVRRWREYTQRLIHTRTGGAESRRAILWDLFDVTNQFLRGLDIPHWSNYGTLLGFYREEDILLHDIDVDMGCEEKYYDQIWEARNQLPKGFRMYDTSDRHYGPKVYISHKGFDADIYFYKSDDELLHSYEKTEWKNYREPIPEKFVFPLKDISVKGKKVMVPGETESYLKHIFGNLKADAKRDPETGYWV